MIQICHNDNDCVVHDKKTDNYFVFMTTDTSKTARQIINMYELRPETEKDFRQMKDFWKLEDFKSTQYNEIVYSTDKKFTKKATGTIAIGKNKTVSKTVSKLKTGKKYYVRIRTYKTIKLNGKSKKLYSSWSKIKTVTTYKK